MPAGRWGLERRSVPAIALTGWPVGADQGGRDRLADRLADGLADRLAGRRSQKGAGWPVGHGAHRSRWMFTGIDPATGERIAKPVWRADPRSKLDAAPLAHALKQRAQERGVRPEELARSAALRRDVRAVLRDDRVTVERADRLARLLGVDPRELFGAEVYAAAGRYRGKRVDVRVAAFDLCFTHPKSISLLLAGGGDRVRAEGNAAREAALDQAIALLEREGLGVRRGHNGTERHQATGGLLAAKFTHRTSREGEPHWHDHVLVQNAVQGPDGRYTAIDSRRMYAWFMTVDHAYQACLRAELSRRLPGLRWRQVDERTGTAEIAGLDDPRLLRAFSSRSDQVAERKAEWAAAGLEVDGIRTSSKAARATRKAKPRGAADERTVYGRWEAELAGHGIDAQAMARVHGLDGRDRHRIHGLAFTALPEATAERYPHVLAKLAEAATAFRTDPLAILAGGDGQGTGAEDDQDGADAGDGGGKPKRDGRRFKVTCACGRSFQVTPKVYEDGPILCGLCSQPFTGDDTADVGT